MDWTVSGRRHSRSGRMTGSHYGRRRGTGERSRRGGRGSWGAKRVAGASTIDGLARAGFVARGVVYIVIGLLAVLVALGFGQHNLDRAGALAAIAGEPFGGLLLWLLVIGFVGLTLWRAVRAATSAESSGRRLLDAARAVVYAVAAWSTFEFVANGRTPTASDDSAHDVSARMLQTDGGRVLMIVLALVAIAVGIAIIAHGASKRFAERLRTGWMTYRTREAVLRLGQFGYVARGVIVVAVGFFALRAALSATPGKAKGLDATLRSFAQTSFGPLVLVVVALGVIAFGLYSFAEARWRRTLGGVPR
jgi:type IV secretory pathway VirB2 component (pilin)